MLFPYNPSKQDPLLMSRALRESSRDDSHDYQPAWQRKHGLESSKRQIGNSSMRGCGTAVATHRPPPGAAAKARAVGAYCKLTCRAVSARRQGRTPRCFGRTIYTTHRASKFQASKHQTIRHHTVGAMTAPAEDTAEKVPTPEINLRHCTETDIPELSELVLGICERDNDPADFSVEGAYSMPLPSPHSTGLPCRARTNPTEHYNTARKSTSSC